MPRLGGSKKDFGLQSEAGISLPGLHENASPSKSSTAGYRSAMPDYDVERRGGGRGQHGGLKISGGGGGSFAPAVGNRNEPPRQRDVAAEKKSKGWFGKGKKSKKGGVPVSVIDEVAESTSMARPSPILRLRTPGRGGEEGMDQFGRPRAAEPEAPEDEEIRMQLSYDAPVEAVSELVKLTLRPGGKGLNKTPENLEVTLRKRGQGFGLHLSTSLHPITVTYVEPGGDAESAGVKVGDVVLEVNGEICENCDAAKIVALKSMIQQTNVLGDSDKEEAETLGSNGITDTTWNKIQARQHQDEAELQKLELTQIDGDSEREEDAPGKFQDKAGPTPKTEKVEISEREWERIREQRQLVFDKNAPSAVIQHPTKKKGAPSETTPLSPSKTPTHTTKEAHQKKKERTPLSSPEKNGTPLSGGGGWFKKKKKKETKGGEGEMGVKQKSASLPRSLTGAVNRGDEGKSKSAKSGGLPMKVTSIDDVEETENGGQVSESIKKTFSYEGALLPQSPDGHVTSHDGHVTSNIPRSRSHNAMFRATLIQAVQQQQQQHQHQHSRTPSGDVTLGAPVISHSRSKSYDEVEEVRETERGRSNGGKWEGFRIGGEVHKTTTDSQTEGQVREEEEAERMDIDPNLRLTKSGVVKEASKRPTLEVFGATKEKKVRGDDSTDGPGSPTTPEDNKPIDLGVIPRTQPLLGRAAGHSRRDLVARGSVKRRLPTKKGSLFFKVDDSQLMGEMRVDLSELSPTHRPRTRTMPEKVSRKLIETAPAFTLPPRDSHKQDTHKQQETPRKPPPADSKSPGTQDIPPQPQQGNSGSSSTRGSERESTTWRQNSNTSTTSSAEMVARVVAARKSGSSSTVEEGVGEGGGGVKREGEGGGTTGSAILARLREGKRVEKERENGEQEAAKMEKTNSASELRSQRRNKMVEKPVKSLGIASESEEEATGSTPSQQKPMVTLRKTPSSEFKPATSSTSTTPSWVAMAEKKKQRVSAMLNKRDSSSAEAQSPTGAVAPPSLSPTSPAFPSPASPPSVATPTSNKESDKSTTPLVTKPTELTTSTTTTANPSPTSQPPPSTKSTVFTSKSTSPPTSTKPTTPTSKSTPFTSTKPIAAPKTISSSLKHTPSPPFSTTVTKTTPSTTFTKTTPSTTFTKTTPSTTFTKSTPSTTVTKSTPSTTVTKSTPSTTFTKSTPSTNFTKHTSAPSSSTTTTKPTTCTVNKSTPSTTTTSSSSSSSPITKHTPKPTNPPPTTSEREPEEGGRPRKGTVKDRMAFFQK